MADPLRTELLAAPEDALAKAKRWQQRLLLAPHPEGGWYRQTYRSPLLIDKSALPGYPGDRVASTMIYFLLSGEEFSALHRLRSDEGWHFYAGSPLVVHTLSPEGEYREHLLGSDPEAGQEFQALVSGGCWFGASLLQPDSFALVGCTVAPGFDFGDFEIGSRSALIRQYPEHSALITRLTRKP